MKHPLQALLACTAIVLCLGACNARVDTDQDRQQIQQLLDTYFQSVKTADVAVASKIWLQSPDIVVVTPLGRFQGWDSVQNELYVKFLQKAFVERDLRPSNVQIHLNGDS